jgi:hypothetical protein
MEDFDEAFLQIMPSASGKEHRKLFMDAKKNYASDRVPIEVLATICAYVFIRIFHDDGWRPQLLISPAFMQTDKTENAE